MYPVFLTAYDGAILGPIAKALGWIMNGIYSFFANVCGIESVALVIFIFTFFIYICLFPVTYRTQKFSVLTRKITPETKAIQEKYKGKRDQASITAMNEETQAVYDKYGLSPMGDSDAARRLRGLYLGRRFSRGHGLAPPSRLLPLGFRSLRGGLVRAEMDSAGSLASSPFDGRLFRPSAGPHPLA